MVGHLGHGPLYVTEVIRGNACGIIDIDYLIHGLVLVEVCIRIVTTEIVSYHIDSVVNTRELVTTT